MPKKNTLKDLNEFLKHQQDSVSKTDAGAVEKKYLDSEPHQISPVDILEDQAAMDEKIQFVAAQLMQIAEEQESSFFQAFIQMTITILEHKKEHTASEMMLLNTALYLSHAEKMVDGYKKSREKQPK